MKKNRSLTSYIEDHEEEEAKWIVKDQIKFEPIHPFSKQIAVKIFVRDEEISSVITESGKEIKVYMPPMVAADDKFRNCTALVIYVASDCYQGDKYQESGPYCKVGDWIVIPRNMGTQVNYRGIPVQIIPEDAIYCVIEDPTHVIRKFTK